MRRSAFLRCLVGKLLALGFLAGPVLAQEAKAVYAFQAEGLACPFCAYGIEKQLAAVEGVVSVETEIKSGTATVTMQDGAILEENVNAGT